MKRNYIIIFFIAISILACKKESTHHSSSSIPGYSQLTVGNYWIYDWYKVDSSGISTFLNISDSVYIKGDTIIGSNTFAIQEGTWFGGSSFKKYLRDSSGYIVNEVGRIFFSATNYVDTLYVWNSMSGSESGFLKMCDIGEFVTVPAGTFKTINAAFTVVNNSGTWPCLGIYDIHKNQYAKNVGKVKSTLQYTSDASCNVYEQRLRTYYVD